MKLVRVVVRMPEEEKQALDRLRRRYAQETANGAPSRAATCRALLRGSLAEADQRAAIEVLPASDVAASSFRPPPRHPGGAT